MHNIKLYVNIAFHYVESRIVFLEKVLSSLQKIKTENTKVIINTNEEGNLSELVEKYNNIGLELDITKSLKHPYYLTWEHKKHIPKFLDGDYTHYSYLEDDMELTDDLVDYWITNRKIIKDAGIDMIPAFHRIEYDSDNEIISVDIKNPQIIEESKCIEINGVNYICPKEPYQGMCFLDKDLVTEYQFFSDKTREGYSESLYGIRELANVEYAFFNVPEGFPNRYLFPLKDFNKSYIHHVTNNYVFDTSTRHGKLPSNKVFI